MQSVAVEIVTKAEILVIAEDIMIKKFIKDITGITAKEEKAEADRLARLELVKKANESLQREKAEARKKAKEEKERKKAEEEAKLTPKERATKKKEPWVDVIKFKVNPDDVRYGFFEVDWNDYWVLKLKQEGYGEDGDPDEDIIARWFRDILLSAAATEGIDPATILAGSIDIKKVIRKNSEGS